MVFSYYRKYMISPILFSVKDPMMASVIPVWYGSNITVIDKERIDTSLFDPGDSFSALNKNLLNHTRCKPELFVFHGGVMTKDGKAYVFLANTKTGKSTLTMFLSQKGWTFINDDYVIISKNNKHVIPDSYPMHLRKGGLDYLKAEGIHLNNVIYIPYLYNKQEESGKYIVTLKPISYQELPINGIFMLNRDSEYNGQQRIVKEPSNLMLKKLLTASLHTYSLQENTVLFVISLLEWCYSVYYSEATDVISLLKVFDSYENS